MLGGSDMFVGEYGCDRDMFFGFFRTHHVVNLERVKTSVEVLKLMAAHDPTPLYSRFFL